MKRCLALLSLAVIACQPPDDGAGPEPLPLEAISPKVWTEKFPEGTHYFEGCRLETLSLDRPFDHGSREGRFDLVESCWTDMIFCTPVDEGRKCTAASWTNRYGGTYRQEDSSLAFAYRFESTTAPEHTPPLGSDSGEVVFKLKHIDWGARLVLERVGAEGLWGKPVLELIKLH